MNIEENKEMTKRFYDEVVNRGMLDRIDQYVSEDAVENEEINPNGREILKQFYKDFRTAFPDLNFTIEDLIAEDDKVVARMTVRGTHNGQGNFLGLTPNGKSLEMETIDIIRFEDGMMVEHWGKADYLGMLQQLGEPLTDEAINNIRSNP